MVPAISHLMRWGFMPGLGERPDASFPLVINIRSETAAEKPSFRAALKHRHAIIPADGFYEWKKEGKAKVQHSIAHADGQMIGTRRPVGDMDLTRWRRDRHRGHPDAAGPRGHCRLHERMPVMLAPGAMGLVA